MKRKFLALLCVVAMLLSLASCDVVNKLLGKEEPQDETCEHTYSDKWSTNSTEHWHAATCEHAELKADVAAHTDADQDGKCDVCDLETGHEHTYADTWTSNDTHHWKVATCSHTEEKGELAAHVDLDGNGECDVCSSHVHVVNLMGDCSVCGEHVVDVDVTDINVVLPIVVANGGKVNGGTITAGSIITDLELEGGELVPYLSGNAQEVEYVLGNGSAYYKVDTVSFYGDSQYTDTQETWYELLADGSVFGVYQYTYDGETSDFEVDGTASADSLVGFYYPVSTLVDAYGAENLLAALFALAQSDAAFDYQYGYEEGTYAFIFNDLAVNSDTGEGEGDHVDYYEVMVYFNASENGVLTDLGVVCSCYTNSLDDELDNDYTYDQTAGTITMKDTAVADVYTFVITQTEGERTYVSEHSKSDFFPESFDAFVDAELTTQLGETVTVTEGNTAVIYFGNFLPESTDAKYIMDTFAATVDEAVFYWAYDGTASFISNVPGTYPVQFTLGNQTFSFTLVVEKFVSDEVEYPENSVVVEITGANTYEWSAVGSFTAPEDGDYTFTVPAGFGAWDKAACDNNFSGSPYVDLYDEDGGYFTVSIKAGETYEFYVTSTTRGVAVITYTVSEYTGSDDDGDDDGVATEVVAGTYYGINGYKECTLVIDTANSTVNMNGYEYAYTFADGVMTLYLNGNAMPDYMLGVTLASDGTPVSFVYNGNSYEVYSGEIDDGDDEPVESGLVIGENTIVATQEDYDNQSIRYTFVVTAEGTYTFSSSNLMANVCDEHGMQIGRGSVYLTEGVYYVDIVLAYTSGAGTYYVTVSYTAPEGADEGDGSEGNPFDLPEIPTEVTFNSDTINKVYYVFTATETGYIYVTLSVENDSWCDLFLFVDGNADGSDSQSSNQKTVAQFAVVAGNTYRLGLGTWAISGETTFSITFSSDDIGGSEGGEGGSDVGGEVGEPDGVIYVGEEATVTVTEDHLNAGKLYLSITIWDSGEYSFESNNLFVVAVVAEDGTVVSRNANYNYELSAWTTYTLEVSTAYVGIAGDFTITAVYHYPEGHQYNPFYYFIGEDAVANYEGNYAPYIWYTFYADTTGTLNFYTDMEGVSFMICGGFGYESESTTFEVMAGRWYYFAVAAFDATEPVDIHFTCTITEGAIAESDGTANLPHNATLGDNVASVPMWDGVYFMYVAEANGLLTLTTENSNCAWYITNDLFVANEEGMGDLTMQLYVGDVVYIYVTTADWNAEDITFNVSFAQDPTESWYEGTVTLDGTANNFYIEENTFLGFQASGMGTYTVTWDADVVVYVDYMPLENGGTVTFSNPYWGPYFQVYFAGYAAGEVSFTFTEVVAEALPLELGDNMVLVTDPSMGTTVSLSAIETTTYLVTVGFETVVVYNYSNYFEGDVLELTVEAGSTVTLQVCSLYFASGYYSVNVTVKPEGDVNLDGAETSATLNFVAPAYMAKAEEQSFVAAEAGTYVITAEGYENIVKTYLQIYDAAADSWTRIDTELPYSVELSAGQTLKFRLFGWSNDDAGKEIVVHIALA